MPQEAPNGNGRQTPHRRTSTVVQRQPEPSVRAAQEEAGQRCRTSEDPPRAAPRGREGLAQHAGWRPAELRTAGTDPLHVAVWVLDQSTQRALHSSRPRAFHYARDHRNSRSCFDLKSKKYFFTFEKAGTKQ